MSREIKFRAWDAPNNEMRYSDKHDGEFYINLNGVMYMYGIPKSKNQYFKSYDVMQYTGIKDRYNRDIYEGDIVKCSEEIMEVIWEKEKCHFVIKCIDMNNFTQMSCTHITDGKYFSNNQLEVIGNIYETPELLSERS